MTSRRRTALAATIAPLVLALLLAAAPSAFASVWIPQISGTLALLSGVSCPTTSNCWAVGEEGAIVATTNGGLTWTAQSSGTTKWLRGVSCPTTSYCWAVGREEGTIVATTNGGSTWTAQSSGTTEWLNDVSCPTTSNCWAVWEGVATLLSTPPSGSGASNTCTSPAAKTVANDFAGLVYAKLTVDQPTAQKIDLCVRVQSPTQNPIQSVGGKLTVDATGVPGVTPIGPGTSNNPTPCTQTVDHLEAGPVDVNIKISPLGANPAYICVISPSLPQPLVVFGGFTGSAATPHLSWTPDPGTPVGPFGI